MKKLTFLILLVFVFSSFVSCQSSDTTDTKNTEKFKSEATQMPDKSQTNNSTPVKTQQKKFLIGETIEAPSLKNNLINESIKQGIMISLPPSYYENETAYPVLYFLHGFGGGAYNVTPIAEIANRLMKEKKMKEMILVGVNGQNKLGGSFFVNSPVTGNWEDYVVKDVVQYIDAKFRTIKSPEARGLAGFSMGGFSAINLGFRNPETFSLVYAVGPGLLVDGSLKKAFPDWDQVFLQAYGAAFSPNQNLPTPYAEIPKFDNSQEDEKVIANWYTGFGDFKSKIQNYLKKTKRLKALKIEYGVDDAYLWIPEGCIAFSKLLKENQIPHELNSFEGGHDLDLNTTENSLLPFFSKNFSSLEGIINCF